MKCPICSNPLELKRVYRGMEFWSLDNDGAMVEREDDEYLEIEADTLICKDDHEFHATETESEVYAPAERVKLSILRAWRDAP